MMSRGLSVVCVVTVIALSGCASSAPAPPSAMSDNRPAALGGLRRLAVVPSGETKFTVAGPKVDVGSVFQHVVKWYPPAAGWAALATALQWGLNWLTEEGHRAAAAPHVRGVSPGSVVAEAFVRTLQASGRFEQVRALDREPIGEARRQSDALVRVIVPEWGLARVREGKPDLMSGYVDVRAQVVRPAGVVVWEHDEDVTHAERLPLQTFTADGELTRQELLEVLDRAGQRLANEFLYTWSGAL